jgi:molecular chaperone DnaK
VAIGAAIQAGVLAGDVKDVLLLDVTPLSLGVETLGGVMTTLIPRNTTVPTRKSEVFSTAEDGQAAVTIHVLQGERPMASDNMALGTFNLEGIPPAPRGVPQIEVTFDIDANGILNVSAQDKATGARQQITITASTNLTQTDVERMVREAEQHAAEDRRRRDLVELRNQTDTMAYQMEKTLRDVGSKISGSDRQAVEERIREVRDTLKTDDADRIRRALEALQQESYRLSQQMYEPQTPPNGFGGNGNGRGPGATGTRPEDEDVIEGEFYEA